jgi:hypothetical protein
LATKITLVIVTAILLTLLVPYATIPIRLAKAQSITPFNTINNPQFSLGPLTNQWWNWIVSVNIGGGSNDPFTDKTGALCNEGLQRNGMLFLVGTDGVTTASGTFQQPTGYERTCNTPIRQGTPILIPLINTECSALHDAQTPSEFGYNDWCGTTPQSQRAQTNLLISNVVPQSVNIAVDNIRLNPQRIQSPGNGFGLTWMPNNPFSVFGAPYNEVTQPTTVQSVADGYWVFLTNLSPGTHTIKFGGAVSFPNAQTFGTEVTYHLTVR